MRSFGSLTSGFVALALGAMLGLAACAPAAAPTTAPVPTTAPAIAPTVAQAGGPPGGPAGTPDPTRVAAAAATAAAFPTLGPGPAIKLARVANFGLFLTDEKDRTLYAYDKDSKDTSTCTGNCATNWPAYMPTAMPQSGLGINPALVSIFKRADGTSQGEYDTHPLYYYSGDKNPGDFKGHGVGGVWHVLSPRGSPMTNAAPAATP